MWIAGSFGQISFFFKSKYIWTLVLAKVSTRKNAHDRICAYQYGICHSQSNAKLEDVGVLLFSFVFEFL